MALPTALIDHPDYLKHDTGPIHPECPARLEVIRQALCEAGLLEKILPVEPKPASVKWIKTVHHPDYIAHTEEVCRTGGQMLDSRNTPVSRESYAVALSADGTVDQPATHTLRAEPKE